MGLREIRAVALGAAAAALLLAAGPVPARADYADGVAAAHATSMEMAIRAWRQAAWQDDDFLAEMRLAGIYANAAESRYYDPVEAYVWYYLASRSDGARRRYDDGRVSGLVGHYRRQALSQQAALLVNLDGDQRSDARDRIVYILSCRGAEGFIKLGQTHDTQSRMNDVDYWEGDQDRHGHTPRDLRMVGILSRSVLTPNDAEALTFFHLADSMGNPLAKLYLESLERRLRHTDLGRRIVAEQAQKFHSWSPAYEFYPPGDNDSGIPYSDECRMTFARARALALVPAMLPKPEIREALAFLGWARAGIRGIQRFQLTLGEQATGVLTPAQSVRAVQTAAVRGDARAQNALGVMYSKGIGVARNYVRAAYWFQKAADQRFGPALYHLGVLYKVGPEGIRQDVSRANDYFTASALAGFRPARSQLKELLAHAAAPGPRGGLH